MKYRKHNISNSNSPENNIMPRKTYAKNGSEELWIHNKRATEQNNVKYYKFIVP
jgi:hypothetical protein